jgi:hypothetical protein
MSRHPTTSARVRASRPAWTILVDFSFMPSRRNLWASLLAVLLLLGAVDLHAPGDTLDSLGHLQEGSYSASARHPGRPAHFEPSDDAQRPICAFCLHLLRTSGIHLLAVGGLEPLARRIAGVQDLAPSSLQGVRSLSGARAPPSL